VIGIGLAAVLGLAAVVWLVRNWRNFWALTGREFGAYFLSPVGYLVLTGFLLVGALRYFLLLNRLQQMAVTGQISLVGMSPVEIFVCYNFWSWLSLIVGIPAITMRLLAEERRSGTIELLLTAPVTEAQIVLSKFVACLGFYGILWLPTVWFLLTLRWDLGVAFAWGPTAAVFLGIFTIGAMFIAIGLFFSSLTRNQVVAAVMTFALMIVIFSLFYVYRSLEHPGGDEIWKAVLQYAAVFEHLGAMGVGAIHLSHLVFHLSVAALMLFVTVRLLQGRKWA